MICRVSRHYPYTIEQAMKLTPRQAYAMISSYSDERTDDFIVLGRMLGAKIDENQVMKRHEKNETIDIKETKELNDITKRHMRMIQEKRVMNNG